jgi:WD40 repeat protein
MIKLQNGDLATASYDKTIKLWNVKSGICVKTLIGHSDWVTSVIELRNGLLVTGSRTIKIWDVKNGTCLKTLTLHGCPHPISYIVKLQNGFFASVDYNEIKIWDVKSGNCLKKLTEHTKWVCKPIELENGMVITTSQDKTSKLWDLKSGTCVQTFTHNHFILSWFMLRNGILAIRASDNTIRLWDVKTRNYVYILSGHTAWVNSLIELKNGNLVSGSSDNTMKVWR